MKKTRLLFKCIFDQIGYSGVVILLTIGPLLAWGALQIIGNVVMGNVRPITAEDFLDALVKVALLNFVLWIVLKLRNKSK